MKRLLIMAVASFAAMYVLMYTMVDRFANVYANIDQVYMAGAMTAAMVLIELAVMRSMYSRRVIRIAAGMSIVVLVLCIVYIRSQSFVGDREFLKAMIPHHGAALLMCQQANLQDPEIQSLCKSIISGQQSQITWMQSKLSTLK